MTIITVANADDFNNSIRCRYRHHFFLSVTDIDIKLEVVKNIVVLLKKIRASVFTTEKENITSDNGKK